MTRIIIGVDPGMTVSAPGGLVALDENGAYAGHLLMPTKHKGIRQRVDCDRLDSWLTEMVDETTGTREYRADPIIAIERVHSMPTDRPKSAFTFGMAVAAIYALVDVRHYPLTEVRPVDWQRVLLRGLPRGDKLKASAAKAAGDLFPELRADLAVKSRWGLADAALIAEYARRQRERSEVL